MVLTKNDLAQIKESLDLGDLFDKLKSGISERIDNLETNLNLELSSIKEDIAANKDELNKFTLSIAQNIKVQNEIIDSLKDSVM